MATKKYLSLERLAEYDALIKAEIAQGDESAKSYADSAATTVKNDLLNGAGEAYDTLKELGDLINVNTDALQALETVATNKADKSDVTTLQELVGETSVDERIETAFANSGANIITPLVPYDSALSSDGSRMNLKFHLEEMEFSKIYGIQPISNVSNYYIVFTVTCDDGTVKNAYAALGNFAGALFKIAGNAKSPDFYCLTAGNTLHSVVIDWSDKSTANNVKITYKPIALTTTNTFEFVPTSNYHPATKKYVDDNFASKADVENIDLSSYETKTDAQTKFDEAKEYTDTQTSGLASTSSVETSISTHNTATDAHNDIRVLITDLTTKLNNFLDVDDTTTDQLSEVLTLIENNKGTLESLTTTKVNVSDIVNNLTTNTESKVLSAAQGVAIKALIDALQTELDSLAIADIDGLQSALDGKAANTLATQNANGLLSAEDKIQLDYGGLPIVTTGGTGAAYTATVDGMVALTTGMSFMMIPHTISTSTAPTLNVSGLGAKTIRRRVSNSTTSTAVGYNAGWLGANKPVLMTYDGVFWIADLAQPSAADISGTLGVAKGGTGKPSVTAGNFLVGDGTNAMVEKTPAEALAHMGVTATAAELNYVDGVTSNIQTQLDTANTNITKKVSDMTLEIYNGTGGNPKPVKFATVNYSTCNSENGVAIKISMVSGHGNGSSYAFLQDAIIRVGFNGGVEVDNFKYYGANAGTYDGVSRQYGDIFWVIDTTNKIVDFYCLMGQYARVYQSPFKRLTYSTGGTITQYTSCTVYSSGDKVYGNNSEYALMSDVPVLPVMTTEDWVVTFEDGTTETKKVYLG